MRNIDGQSDVIVSMQSSGMKSLSKQHQDHLRPPTLIAPSPDTESVVSGPGLKETMQIKDYNNFKRDILDGQNLGPFQLANIIGKKDKNIQWRQVLPAAGQTGFDSGLTYKIGVSTSADRYYIKNSLGQIKHVRMVYEGGLSSPEQILKLLAGEVQLACK